MKIFKIISMLVALTVATSPVALAQSKTITVKGSDTMVILGQRWAEVYMKKNKDVVIQVTGGGSGTGIAALINKTTDIANSSRPIKDKEKQQIEGAGAKLIEVPVALDGLAVYVNSANPIKELDMETIKLIFTGKIKNWSELGWDNKVIKLYSRENNSGTYVYFKEHVLQNEDFDPLAQNMPGTASVLNAVKRDKYGIGYGGIGYLKGARAISVSPKAGEKAYEPSMDNVVKGLYPISRYLYIYLTEEQFNRPEIKAYISWILSKEGQGIVDKVGFYPIPSKKVQEIRKSLGL
ncbi:MAG: PstS family phosphate ABC transporter substrate-binding protein [Spirochaetia bacterium]|nr:PstS family phosphate ABC transporter substrate-binding protein [Spirochaetota bacterium]MDW8112447.1 PstS family phosphate ABC transporter substrate-binding protein [Spirochaetia bacterium]